MTATVQLVSADTDIAFGLLPLDRTDHDFPGDDLYQGRSASGHIVFFIQNRERPFRLQVHSPRSLADAEALVQAAMAA